MIKTMPPVVNKMLYHKWHNFLDEGTYRHAMISKRHFKSDIPFNGKISTFSTSTTADKVLI